jgi:competence protein ComEC
MVPAALAVTAGILLDRNASVPLVFSLMAAALALIAWLVAHTYRRPGWPLLALAVAGAAFGAALHHYRRDFYPADDIGNVAPAEPHPAQLRGFLDEEPLRTPASLHDPLRTLDRPESTVTVLRVTQLKLRDDWGEVSGRVRLLVSGSLPGLHAGDEVDAVGRLSQPHGPANPGEFDYAGLLRDQGIRAQFVVAKTADGVTRLGRGWPGSFTGWLAIVRGWGQEVFARLLPQNTSGIAQALLLGEGSTMTTADWDKYVRTGVIHVLAISGQHLVVLGAAVWWILRRLGLRQRRGAWFVALFLLAYALLTGGRPPALRSAVMVFAACGGLILRRRTPLANFFALAWLTVALLNPTDLFTAGCLLSFLSVAVLYWGPRHWFGSDDDPLSRLMDETRPPWQRWLRDKGRRAAESYAVTVAIWLAIAPLAASQYHLISPVGLLLGPPLTLLTSVALLFGFLMLAVAAVCEPLAALFTPAVHWSLSACEWLVDVTDSWPGSHVYVGDVPGWWLWVFYLALFGVLTQAPLRRRWRWALGGAAGWLCVGLLSGFARLPPDEFRCTFLAVGHGGCTVLELPDGRTLLYDAGAISGPDVSRRQIAPFLWSRGVRRIDEVILSHADLDHFNGLPALLDRFSIGQVTCTPTFADKDTPGVAHTLAVLRHRGIPTRIVKAGDRLAAGDVTLEVLHPPPTGPDGNENARSLVLEVCHAGHTLLLTGDLEGPGLERVLALQPHKVDVLMAPHHGSRKANTPGLAAWARPQIVISCQGPPQSVGDTAEPYKARGARFLGTWPEGAVTLHSHRSGLVVETFVTRQRFIVRGSN